MTKWMPIETAPQDQKILVYCAEENEYYVAFLENGIFYRHGGEQFDPDSLANDETPTHWMPLPAPPSK